MYNASKPSIYSKDSIKEKFDVLKQERSNYESTWELCAQYTLPEMYLSEEVRSKGIDPEDTLVGDSGGAELLSNLSGQVMKWAFPAKGAFFRYMAKEGSELANLTKSKRNDILLRLEESAMQALKDRMFSSVSLDILIGMLGLGNVVYLVPEKKGNAIQVFDLNDTVIKRSPSGIVTDIIIRECYEYRFIKDTYKKQITVKEYNDYDIVEVYTHVSLNSDKKYEVRYAIDTEDLPYNGNYFTEHTCPYRVSALNPKKNTNYATGIVQRYLALIHKSSVYSDTATDTAVSGSLLNWLIKNGSAIDPEEFSQREQGQAFYGQKDDVTPIMADVSKHLQLTDIAHNKINQTLHRVFLMFSAIQRDAERVTAEEIRTIASRLEESHTGLKSTIGDTLQRPLAMLALHLIDDKELNQYKDSIDVYVVSALEAMSRNAEQDNLLVTLNDTSILNSVSPQVQEVLKTNKVIGDIFSNRGYQSSEYIKTEEEVMQERQALADMQNANQPQPNQSQVYQENDALIDAIQQPLI